MDLTNPKKNNFLSGCNLWLKIKKLIPKILITMIYAAVLMVLKHFGVPCIFTALLGIPCPGCGMTRAVFSALKLELAAAFQFHPMFWSVPILYLYFLSDGKLFKNKTVNKTIFIIIAAGFIVAWLVKIFEI